MDSNSDGRITYAEYKVAIGTSVVEGPFFLAVHNLTHPTRTHTVSPSSLLSPPARAANPEFGDIPKVLKSNPNTAM